MWTKNIKEVNMIKVRFATEEDAKSISNLCSKAWKVTYADIYSKEYIDKVIAEFYNVERIAKESTESSSYWHGYIVAYEDEKILGCIGGAIKGEIGSVFVLYVDPDHKGQGVGSTLLEFLTDYQKENYGITRQEVFVTTGNMMGIPFYEKKGCELVGVIPNWIDDGEGTQGKYQRLV